MSGKSNLPPFMCQGMPSTQLRSKWIQWKRAFHHVAVSEKITDPTELKSKLLAVGGFDLQDVFYSIPGADVEADEKGEVDPYKVAIEKLDAYFAPKQHATFERYIFWSLKPEPDESLGTFLLRAQQQANKCEFGATEAQSREICVKDKAILLADAELKEKLLQKEMSLDEIMTVINTHHSVKFQSEKMNLKVAESSEFSSSKALVNRVRQERWKSNAQSRLNARNFQPSASTSKLECFRCGQDGHIATDTECPAINQSCNNCRKRGHFASKCRSLKRNGNDQFRKLPTKKSRIRAIEAEEDRENENGSNELANESFIFSLRDENTDITIPCTIGKVQIEMLIDSGSSYNIVDGNTWELMKQGNAMVWNQKTEVRQIFKAYASETPLQIIGSFDSNISVGNGKNKNEITATFFVVKDGDKSLLGRNTAMRLNVLKIGLAACNELAVYNISKRRFPKIKGIKITIPIDKSVPGVVQQNRRVPIALQKGIESKLKELLELDIIEKVNQPSEWVSPLVPIIKDNGDLRLCVDMRRANTAIKRENHPLPTIEDFLPRLRYAKYFSRLDVKNAFHQIELQESCRYITTFICLMFGINCAPEIFQKTLENIIIDIKNAYNYIDDVIIFGSNEEEHDRAIEEVLKRFKDYNIELNYNKCVFKVTSMEFLGHHITQNGVKPSVNKIKALQSFRAPESAEELRSFLGLVTYVGRFLPDLGTKTFVLRNLTRNNVKFEWTEAHEHAFTQIKHMISNIDILGYFDPKDKTRVVADASPVALGAVLLQFSNNEPRVICYASKSLTDTERRYCQTEKEALALVWAVEKFRIYLVGLEFELETDHKPLETIFSTNSRPCARIERWVLRLQSFKFRVVYRKGSANIADSFSRLCVLRDCDPFDSDCETYIRAIQESAAIDISEVEAASEDDPEISIVRECVKSNRWCSSKAKPFEKFKLELVVTDNLLLKGTKLVIPQILRYRMLELAHEGHPGETVMKRRIRERAWWPGVDDDVKNWVLRCKGCQLVAIPGKPEGMQRKELPNAPWVDVAIDFLGPLPSNEYIFVIIDYFSRYKEIEIMTRITSRDTIERVDKIFGRLGYPRTITLDNGKQFISEEFVNYCKRKGIRLNNTIPYWPQQNGEVERQNRSLLKRLRISHTLNRDWKRDLRDYLMMYYTTPHSTTGKTPTELCLGRTIRSKLPSIGDLETIPPDSDFRERDALMKEKGRIHADEKRGAKSSDLQVGDSVLMQNLGKGNKLATTFSPEEFEVVTKSGPRVEVRNKANGKSYERNSAHLKRIPQSDPVPTGSDGRHAESLNAPTESTITDPEDSSSLNVETVTIPTQHTRSQRQRKLPTRFNDYELHDQ